ncbi:MAG TPA: CHAT domain-containing protein [Lunatimonas sp.]|nr:CHAT domain-containing protein [Lunatimonas sp.]
MKISYKVLLLVILDLVTLSPLFAQSEKVFDLYQEGLRLFELPEPTEETDSLAIRIFQELLRIPSAEVPREIQFDSQQKLGILFLIEGKPERAIRSLLVAKNFFELGGLADTLVFKPLLYLGDSYFMLNKGDSSIFYLKQAERILEQKQSIDDKGRLYNSLGVTYYEMGNYVQAITYFSKAKSLVWKDTSLPPPNANALFAIESFQSNEASAYANLREFKKAISLYLDLLEFTSKPDAIYSKLASLYVERSLPDSAAFYMEQIQSDTERELLVNRNLVADIYIAQGKYAQAESMLRKLISEKGVTEKENYDNTYQLGISYKLLSKVYLEKGAYAPALEAIQQAIVRFSEGFSSLDYRVNPDPSSNNWGMLALFDCLLIKADVFLKAANSGYSNDFFILGFDTFRAAFSMVYYMGNFYDNEEARLFLGEKTQAAYRDAIVASMKRYSVTGDKRFAWQAFNWTEESKSSALELALNEQLTRTESGVSHFQRQEERDLKMMLSKTNRQILENEDPENIPYLENKIRDIRLALSRIYSTYQPPTTTMDTTWVKDRLDHTYISGVTNQSNTALLSFFWEGSMLYRFIITNEGIQATEIREADKLNNELDSLQELLLSSSGKSRSKLDQVSREVFHILFSDVESLLGSKAAWVVFPDGKLTNQPIEMLINTNGKYLVENHVISYQFSAKFLASSPLIKPDLLQNAVGFAPFSKIGNSVGKEDFSVLPFAEVELEGVNGQKYLHNKATKQQFLSVAENASIIHLATHAKAELEDPDRAFIAFFPDEDDFRLYYDELYSLNLHEARLVFLSACDTHSGNILSSEGLISLSRAFAYAGCPNIVGSIWKAEDKVVAYLSHRFYKNLENGVSMAKALQLAKVELLRDPTMAQYNHPYFWSSLVFIGGLSPEINTIPIWIWVLIFIIALSIFVCIWLYLRKLRSNRV